MADIWQLVTESHQDNTVVTPGEAIIKTWTLMNIGDDIWTPEYKVRFSHGEQLSAANEFNLPHPVGKNETVDISVNLMIPNTLGEVTGFWSLIDENASLV